MKLILRIFLGLLTIFICYSTSAQIPNISYPSPQKLYVGKVIAPISPSNTGGSVPVGYNPSYTSILTPNQSVPGNRFIMAPSGDIYGTSETQVYQIKSNGEAKALAGGNSYGYLDGTGAAARFNGIAGITVDGDGNVYTSEGDLYDAANAKIRKITPQGVVSTFVKGLAGVGRLAMGADGYIYTYNNEGLVKISKIGVVSVVATPLPPVNNTPTDQIGDITIDKTGNIYLVDMNHSLIKMITPTGVVSTFAGSVMGDADGTRTSAKFSGIGSIAFDSRGVLWVNDVNVYKLKKITPDGNISTVSVGFSYMPISISLTNSFFIDKQDNIVVFNNNVFYKLNPTGYRSYEKPPDGLTFNPDGSITGTPTSLSPAHDYNISATNDFGTSTTTLSLEVVAPPEPPVITSFAAPFSVPTTEIQIHGSNFLNATSVSIGGKLATSFTVMSSTLIGAQIPIGATSGNVAVTTQYGTATLGGLIIIPPPVITSVSPLTGKSGDKITINGSSFNTTVQVLVGGQYAAYNKISDTELEVTLQSGASGDVTVNASSGSANFAGFVFIYPPSISSFTPTSAAGGITVTITGNNFNNASSVKFGVTAAASFEVVSATSIKAVVGSGSSGAITVGTPAGSNSAGSFNFIAAPLITSVSPLKAGVGSTVTINGSNLLNGQVTVGGKTATIIFNGSNQISFTVPNGATSGDVKVTTAGGSATSAGFTFVSPPQVTSFSPASAGSGEHITINGQNFTDATLVTFGGAFAQFTIVSPTVIDAVVGQGLTGNVSVRSPGGESSLSGFVYKGPIVNAFAPIKAGDGETVTITGSNFIGVTKVTFGGVDARSFTVTSATEIKAVVGTGTSGSVSVTTPMGLGLLGGFSHPGPSITSFSPNYAGPLSTTPIIIAGSNFTGTTSVSFGGVPAASFTVTSATSISAVPAASATGDVEVSTPLGTVKRTGFIWLQPPTISSFSPAGQKLNGNVIINGTNFIGVTAVKFGGVNAQTFGASSATRITAFVGNGASGDVTVTTVGGTVSLPGFTYTNPSITSISPAAAGAGQTVTVTGNNLNGVQQITFGSNNAASFTIVSNTEIKAVLGAGASGGVVVDGPSGSASYAGFTYVYPATLSYIEPKQGGTGTEITIQGANLLYTQEVKIGGMPVDIISKTNNVVKVRAGDATSGTVVVQALGGNASIEKFEWFPAPVITSFSPTSSNLKDTVTVVGSNFSQLKNIMFGNAFGEFWQVTDTQMKLINIGGGTGTITVNATGGSTTVPGYTFIKPPSITSYTVNGEGEGSTIVLIGKNFYNVKSITLGRVAVKSFVVNSPDKITVTAGSGENGSITVTTQDGTAIAEGYIYNLAPAIDAVTPLKGPAGTLVTITGKNFNLQPGNNIVYFGPVKAEVVSASKTKLEVKVPQGAGNQIIVIEKEKRLTAYSPLDFYFTRSTPITGYSGKFEISVFVRDQAYSPPMTAVADFDNDGKTDIVIGIGDSVNIYQNTGNYFSKAAFKKINVSVNRRLYKLIVGDVDSDGRPDILFTHNQSIVVMRNTTVDSNISFETKVIPGYYDDELLLRDFDSDGKPDLMVDQGIYKNTSLDSDISFNTFVTFKGQVVGDISGDGRPDIVVAGSTGLGWYYNQAINGKLTDQSFLYTNETFSLRHNFSNFLLSDYNGDGRLDVLAFDDYNRTFFLKRNSSGPMFEEPSLVNSSYMGWNLISTDINADGKPDVIGTVEQSAYAFINNSQGSAVGFNSPVEIYRGKTNDYFSNYLINDIDADGFPDVLMLDNVNKKLIILHNGVVPIPQITSITPTAAHRGEEVTITGKYFSGTTAVTFGTKPVQSFKVVSADVIKVIVGDGETGAVKVQTPDGLATHAGFIFQAGDVVKTKPVITFPAIATRRYGDADIELTATSNNTDISLKFVLDNPDVATIVNNKIHILKAGSVKVTASQAGNSFYEPAESVQQTIMINNAALAITADDKAKVAGKPNPAFTLTYSGFVNGETSATLTQQPVVVTTATAASGGGVYDIVASGAVADNYDITYNKGKLTITKDRPVITFPAIAAHHYGDADIELTAASTNIGVPLSYSVDKPDVATIVDNKIHILKAGSVKVTASQAGNSFYEPAENVQQTLLIDKATLTITADDKTRVAGKPNPAFTVNYSGFVNGETSGILTQQPVVTTTATAASGAGVYDIVASGAGASNYDITYNNGKLTITKDRPVITFPAIAVRRYGDADIELAATSTNAGVSLTYSVDKPDVATVVNNKIHILKAGSVKVTANQEGNSFYESAESVQQTLLIDKVALVVTADDKTRAVGKPDPAFTVSYQGFVKSETSVVFGQQPVITTTATASSVAAIYDIVASGAVSANYSFTYNNGKLTITPALDNLKVSATNVTCKGQANGNIAIIAKQTASYTAVLTGNSINRNYTFTANLNIDNLSPGIYNVCVSDAALPGQKRCFDLTITEPKDLSVYTSVVQNTSLLNISLAGGDQYQVTLNGRMYSTRNNSITLELNSGSNKLEVVTDKDCQGKVEQIINYSGNPVPYPNPFNNELFVNVGVDEVTAAIKIYSVTDGSLKLTEQFKNVSGVIKLDVSKLKMGIYSVHVTKGNIESVYKVIKQ